MTIDLSDTESIVLLMLLRNAIGMISNAETRHYMLELIRKLKGKGSFAPLNPQGNKAK